MIRFRRSSRVLVTLELPDPEPLAERLVEALSSLHVLLLGWYEVPEQTSPEQARQEVEDTGEEALAEIADELRDAGAEVETRMVFTGDPVETVQRVGAEESYDAVLINAPLPRLESVLVALRKQVSPRTVADLVADLTEGNGHKVTLLHVSTDEADEGRERTADVLEMLEERGVDTDAVESRVETSDEPDRAVLEACRDGEYDLLVVPEVGEIEDRLFGSFAEEVARKAELPVLVLRGREDDDE